MCRLTFLFTFPCSPRSSFPPLSWFHANGNWTLCNPHKSKLCKNAPNFKEIMQKNLKYEGIMQNLMKIGLKLCVCMHYYAKSYVMHNTVGSTYLSLSPTSYMSIVTKIRIFRRYNFAMFHLKMRLAHPVRLDQSLLADIVISLLLKHLH